MIFYQYILTLLAYVRLRLKMVLSDACVKLRGLCQLTEIELFDVHEALFSPKGRFAEDKKILIKLITQCDTIAEICKVRYMRTVSERPMFMIVSELNPEKRITWY